MLRTIHDPLGLTQCILCRNVDLYVDDSLYWQPCCLRQVLIQFIRALDGFFSSRRRHTRSCRVPQVDVRIDNGKCNHSFSSAYRSTTSVSHDLLLSLASLKFSPQFVRNGVLSKCDCLGEPFRTADANDRRSDARVSQGKLQCCCP